jgi:hypothetical protein
MDDLLIKYIMEEASPEESNQVQQWLAANDANRARFENLRTVWQLAAQPSLPLVADTPQALQRLKQTLQARETASIKRIRPRVWTAAAAIVGIAGVALGAYVWMKPKDTVKEHPPVVQPDTVLQQPLRVDTVPPVPAVQPVPALPADTLPFVKPHKKKRPVRVTPEQRIHPKKKTAQQPTQPTKPVKKKHPVPAQSAHPVRKHKSKPTAPEAPVKEPPIS